MHGINQRPLPAGDVSVHPNGHVIVSAAGDRQYELRSNGTLASFQSQGRSASFRPDGHLSAIHTPTLNIRHNVNGSRTIVTQRPDKTVLVGTGPRTGYLERSVVLGNRTFIQRTFVSERVTYTRTFTTYFHHGMALEHFVPAFYFAPAFYGWAYYPWDTPVPYTWTWVGDPWYAFYSSYFTPYPVYPSGFAWLTDYFLARTLADAYAYQQQMQAAYDAGATGDAPPAEEDGPPSDDTVSAQTWTPITPELKAAIAEEVQHQLAYENAASTDTLPPDVGELPSALKPNHVFVVASNLDVTTAEQQTCGLSPGDVLQLTETPSNDSPVAALRVASSKRADCPAGVQVMVSLQDLQDMQNNMRAQIDFGLQDLRSRQGANGLPAAPQSAIAPPPRPVLTDGPTPPSVDVAGLLDAQQREAIQAEAGITQSAFVDQPVTKR
jgi:hypothetical protein